MFKFSTVAQMKFISRIVMGFSSLALAALFLFSYYGQKIGNFTIDVSQDLYLNKEMVLSESVDFKESSSRLLATPIGSAAPIGIRGEPERIPIEIENIIDNLEGGNNNGLNYFAYTFYAKNSGSEEFSYNFSIYIEDSILNLDAAVRVMIIKESDIAGNKIVSSDVYAKPQSEHGTQPGKPEPGSIPFEASKKVIGENRYDFAPGQMDKYSILMWLHGEDPDCTDLEGRSVKDGAIKLTIKFNIIT